MENHSRVAKQLEKFEIESSDPNSIFAGRECTLISGILELKLLNTPKLSNVKSLLKFKKENKMFAVFSCLDSMLETL